MGSKPAKPVAKAIPAPRTRTTKPMADPRIAALEAALAALTQRLDVMERLVERTVRPERGRNGAESKGDETIRAAVLSAVGELDLRHRYGGLVPIPDVRAELRRTGLVADDAAVTAALEALERAWTIDLSVAQSPTQVADRAAGIERPGRGLLYYVARR